MWKLDVLDVLFCTSLKLWETYLQNMTLIHKNASTTMWFPMNLAISCLMMPHFVLNDLANLGMQLARCNSLIWFCTLSQNIVNFCPFTIIGFYETWRNKQQSCHSSSTINVFFFFFDCNCLTSLATLDALTRFINVILCTIMSTS